MNRALSDPLSAELTGGEDRRRYQLHHSELR
jgi:hypothetical protein